MANKRVNKNNTKINNYLVDNGSSPQAYRWYQKQKDRVSNDAMINHARQNNIELSTNVLTLKKMDKKPKAHQTEGRKSDLYNAWIEDNNNTTQTNRRDDINETAYEKDHKSVCYHDNKHTEINSSREQVEEIFNILSLLDKTLNKQNIKTSVSVYNIDGESLENCKNTPRWSAQSGESTRSTQRQHENNESVFDCDGIRAVHFKRKQKKTFDDVQSSCSSLDPDKIDDDCLKRNNVDYIRITEN